MDTFRTIGDAAQIVATLLVLWTFTIMLIAFALIDRQRCRRNKTPSANPRKARRVSLALLITVVIESGISVAVIKDRRFDWLFWFGFGVLVIASNAYYAALSARSGNTK